MARSRNHTEEGWGGSRLFIFLTIVVPVALLALFIELRVGIVERNLAGRTIDAPSAAGSRDASRSEIDALPWHPVQGQQLYVPAYSHVFHQKGIPYLLTVTLYVRNTSATEDIVVTSVRYFDTTGREIRALLSKPLRLGPLAATEFVIERKDKSGGSGASFLVEWFAGTKVTPPVVESLMIDTGGNQGISFRSPAVVLNETLVTGASDNSPAELAEE